MAEQAENQLSFSIEESVWLKKGQEVDEIVSMSLEPDISIVENKHYVSVRGSLKLTGEYRPLSPAAEETDEPLIEEERSLNDQAGMRPVDELTDTEDGTVQIEHQFPVDITIPLSRIERLEDIYVTVDQFDYTLPENDCLRLDADISISGMAEEEEHLDDNAFAEDQSEIEPVASGYDIREEEVEDEYEESYEAQPDEEAYEAFHYEAVREASDEEQEEVYHEQPLSAARNRGPLVEMKSRLNEPEEEPAFSNYEEEYEEETVEPVREISESEPSYEEYREERPHREENALYLTKMLTKDEEEFSRLKMCIIQQGDSLDTIAERYDLPLTHLLRVNHMESEEVEEGQILYIPVSS
ncbi:MAG TPA: stage VI sporulation protein D [Bacillales bacterium]|nr:stage VI sporulation protein D [Bacillales bacterium]